MRALAVHADVLVFVSAFAQTTCTAVRGGEEGFVIDSPVLPDELDALPKVLSEAGVPVSGRLATHGDWDHVLSGFAFPGTPLGCAESTAARLAAEPGEAARDLKNFDEGYYVERPGPLVLGSVQPLPVPGHVALEGERELELHRADGHTLDGMAVLVPWAGILACGDYLSPVEIPWISETGSLGAYRATLERLRPLVASADTLVPGHGSPIRRETALRILDEDVAYLTALERDGPDAQLPEGRDNSAQRRIHAENVGRVEG